MSQSKKKIITLVGTRPEIIKLSLIIKKLDKFFNHILVNSNQNFNYELNKIFFNDLSINAPKYNLNIESKSPIETISKLLKKFDTICKKENPDAVVILGDTNSCLGAYAAKRRKIPIFHIEAGNRCFDQRVPEEINRKIIDHLSDINLTYSHISREYLLNENLPPDRVINIGSPLKEVFEHNKKKINSSKILKKLKIKKNQYILVSFHREENVDFRENIKKFCNILLTLKEKFNLPIIVSTHYRLENKIKKLKNYENLKKNINFLKPFSYSDYCHLEIFSKFVLSDSGTITEDSSIMNFPAINIRETHERPEGMEEASVIMTGLDINNILEAINIISSKEIKTRPVMSYDKENVSSKVVKIILSYIDFVNQKVWNKI
tara:strand:- start:2435 stop:3565 length:1131 start_codon:yes stop_codon:yes gene_type:complete